MRKTESQKRIHRERERNMHNNRRDRQTFARMRAPLNTAGKKQTWQHCTPNIKGSHSIKTVDILITERFLSLLEVGGCWATSTAMSMMISACPDVAS